MCQGWERHIAYIGVYIARVNTVVVWTTGQHFQIKKFVYVLLFLLETFLMRGDGNWALDKKKNTRFAVRQKENKWDGVSHRLSVYDLNSCAVRSEYLRVETFVLCEIHHLFVSNCLWMVKYGFMFMRGHTFCTLISFLFPNFYS